MKATGQLHDLGQSLWLDHITRQLLNSGTLKRYISELSVTGLTSNPTIFDHAISGSADYDEDIRRLVKSGLAGEDLFFELALQDLKQAAQSFAEVHKRSAGVDGWVSLEVSPLLAFDTIKTINQAKTLHQKAGAPNIFIKIPGTKEGAPAIEEATFAGVQVNVTLLFSREHYLRAADAYMRGLERRLAEGLSLDVRSVASIFISRWDNAIKDKVPAKLRNRLGIAVGHQTYKAYRDVMDSDRWQRLENEGARCQRLLFASTSTKDPEASDVLYISALAAPNTVNTIPEKTLLAFADHGQVKGALARGGGEAETVLHEFEAAGFDLAELAARLQTEGAKSFSDSWDNLQKTLEEKVKKLK
jgi:transaldolase